MNTPSGIAATTLAFRNLLRTAVPAKSEVTTVTPGQAETAAAQAPVVSLVNLGLWSLAPSASIINHWVPERRSPSGKGNPTPPSLPIDLRYIVTAYSATNPANADSVERLLGAVLKAVHDHPVLTSAEIASALDEKPPMPFPGEATILAETLPPSELAGLFTASRAALRPALLYRVTLTWS